jgi:hypothetical protein
MELTVNCVLCKDFVHACKVTRYLSVFLSYQHLCMCDGGVVG